ncbi:MAG: LacI family DNA-binding transcriptional regulator [Rubricoccaceae bacterium]|nr:LacI family DNA-binding transcriptional regulator [Rubricoccaceae bacterium]
MDVTIRDVARRAGVSIATVSRALNNSGAIREDTRRAVVRAARELGYWPNPAARSLHGKATGGLGVLLPYVSGEFFAELLSGLDEGAQAGGRFILVSTSHRRSEEFQAAIRAMSKRVDGLVVMAPALDTLGVESVLSWEGPVTFINTSVDGVATDVLNFDNYGGAFALTRHLLDAGHRRIALIKGAPGAWDAQERARGYRAALAEAGAEATPDLEFEGEYTQAAGYAVAPEILAVDPRPTAILAANDYCAAGVLSALSEAEIAVPDEMAVAGFDGVTSAQYMLPPLTTVHVPIRSIGYRAIQQLIARLEDRAGADPVQEVIPVDLVIRESTRADVPHPTGGGSPAMD